MDSPKFKYDFTNKHDVKRFKKEHVEKNEDAWLKQVGKMESDHGAITTDDIKRYRLLENLQRTLDRISEKLSNL